MKPTGIRRRQILRAMAAATVPTSLFARETASPDVVVVVLEAEDRIGGRAFTESE